MLADSPLLVIIFLGQGNLDMLTAFGTPPVHLIAAQQKSTVRAKHMLAAGLFPCAKGLIQAPDKPSNPFSKQACYGGVLTGRFLA